MALLQIEDVNVAFGGLLALTDVAVGVEASCVTGLIGPNGAGKTTMFNVVTGLQAVTRGRVMLDGEDISRLAPHKRARRGLARTFQRLEVFGSLSVFENVLTGAEIHGGWGVRGEAADGVADRLVERVGLLHVRDERVDALPTGSARLVELARALATAPRVLLLDEPSSGLDEGESAAFGSLLEELASEGLAVLLVEHDVELVMRVCSTIHVLDFGRIIASGDPSSIQRDVDVQSAYLGGLEVITGG